MAFLPPGVTSATAAAFPQVFYDNVAVREWQFNTPFIEQLCDYRPLARRSGRTIQFYGQKPYNAATGNVSEGIPGPSLQLSQVVSDAFADEFGDWIGISNVVDAMFISDIAVDASRNLSYRGALTANLIAANAFDNAANTDSTSRIDLQDNEFLISNTFRKAEAQLQNNAVTSRDGGMYTAAISPLMAYDLLSDNISGSATDSLKRTDSGVRQLQDGQSRGYQILEWSGVRIIRTPTVPTYTNYPSAGKTGYGLFIVGKEAMLASELMGQKAPRNPGYKVNVYNLDRPDLSNPMLQTKAIVSYDFFLGVVGRPLTNGTNGFRRVRGEVGAV